MVALDIAGGAALASTAVAAGSIVFARAVWMPALRLPNGALDDSSAVSDGDLLACRAAFAALVASIVIAAAGIGLVSSAAVLALDDGAVARETAAWAVAAVAWVALVGIAAGVRAGALARAPSAILCAALVCAGLLILVPGVAGNAAAQGPAALLIPANAVHVVAASVWTGGIVCLLIAVRPALAVLPGAAQTRVLVAVAAAFSALALVAVVALALSGVIQSVALVGRIDALVTTGYGRLVMIKGALLCGLALAGAAHRARALPALRDAADQGLPPGAAGAGLRHLLVGEAVMLALVFASTAALAVSAPPVSDDDSVVRVRGTLGLLDVRLTARPGSPGANTLRLALTDRSGAAPAALPRLSLTARQRRLGIGPLRLNALPQGPGLFIVPNAALDAPGSWEIAVGAPGGARTTLRLRLR